MRCRWWRPVQPVQAEYADGPRGHHPVHHGCARRGLAPPANGRPGAGDTFIYYDPERNLDPAHRMPFATIVTKDYGEFDNASRLDRPGVFRLNIGVSRDTFRNLFGYAPGEEGPARAPYDYAALDTLMPHPVYAAQSYVCVLSPSPETFKTVKLLLADAYSRAAKQYASTRTRPD